MSDVYQPIKDLEAELSRYTGAPEVVVTNCCTNAITLCLMLAQEKCWDDFLIGGDYRPWIEIPKLSYVSIAQAAKNTGYDLRFRDEDWSGIFQLKPLNIFDSARRMTSQMYIPGSFMCLSFHNTKILKSPLGGGAILTEDEEAAAKLRRMRFDGRQESVHPGEDEFVRGMRANITPGHAAELHRYLVQCVAPHNPDLPRSDYSDLSKAKIFQ